jgi:glycosyltransferase involved in cell wall biosynthesis
MALPAGIVGHILSVISGVPHVLWHHGNEVHGYDPVKGASVLFKVALRKIWPTAYANFFVSQSLLNRANKIGGLSRASILPVAVEPPVAFVKNRTLDSKIFLFAGRLEPDKNVGILLDAIAILQRKNLCAQSLFCFAGDGTLNKTLRKQAARLAKPGQTIFLGAIHPDKMKGLYNDAYALILPSLMEGYPLTILEAATYKVPTIGSDTEGIRDAVVHGKTGLLCKLNDAEQLAAAISLLAGDSGLRNQLGENAFNRSLSFPVANTADILLRAVQEIVHCPDRAIGIEKVSTITLRTSV